MANNIMEQIKKLMANNVMEKISFNKNVYVIKQENEEKDHLETSKHKNKELKDDNLIDYFLNKNKHLFIFFYLDGCPPCNETKLEWDKFNSVNDLNDDVVVMRINQSLKDRVTKSQNDIFVFKAFPHIIYVKKGHGYGDDNLITEHYNGKRDFESFKRWIQEKTKSTHLKGEGKIRRHGRGQSRRHGRSRRHGQTRRHRRSKRRIHQ